MTSGGYAPYLKKSIGLAYLPADRAEPGQAFEVEIRARPVPAEVVPTPFYVRPDRRGGRRPKKPATPTPD